MAAVGFALMSMSEAVAVDIPVSLVSEMQPRKRC
jgi:hypothetical protein